MHPNPEILTPAGLNFYADLWVLGGIWSALLIFAWLGKCCAMDEELDDGLIKRKWLLALLSICLLLTVAPGVAFGAGSRY